MGQRYVAISFLVVAVLALGAAGFNAFKDSLKEEVSPTPTPQALLFQDQKGDSVQQTNSSSQPTIKPAKRYTQFPGVLPAGELQGKKAVIDTNKGQIQFEIFPEVPKTASNFIFLANDGFYDNLTFHRVEPGFVIQGGDPSGNGTGGPGYKFEDEPVTRPYDKGIVAMANAGPNTNGSQFFIMLQTTNLPPNYTIFGKVISGQEVVDKIQVGDVMKKVSIESVSSK